MWSTLFSMAMPPHFTVVDTANHVEGFADSPGIEDGSLADTTDTTAGDEGGWWESDSTADTGGYETDTGGGGWWDSFGDSGGGDFGDW
jgi:hypothetical protein